jgi:hypothetical protein
MWDMGKGLCWIRPKTIRGCVVIVWMRRMVSLSQGKPGKAGMSLHGDVVRCVPFPMKIAGCVSMLLMVLGKASRDMPYFEETG